MPPPGPTVEQWESYKPMLWELWTQISSGGPKAQKGMTTAEIGQQMQQRYGFYANKNAYDRQFKTWGWRKNLTPDEWHRIDQHTRKRKRELGKDSEVRLNGALIDSGKKAKSHYKTVSDQLALTRQQSAPLPENVFVCTPGNYASGTINLDSLPWNSFLRSAEVLFRQLAPLPTSSSAGGTHVKAISDLQISAQAFDAIERFTSVEIYLRDESKHLQGLIYSVSNNFRTRDTSRQARHDYDTEISRFFDIIKRHPVGFLEKAFATVRGLTVQTFIATVIGEAFWRDEVKIAAALLAFYVCDINEPIRLDDREVINLVDLIGSSEMAKLFTSRGGDLLKATKPFARLMNKRFIRDEAKQHGILGEYIRIGHEDLASSLYTMCDKPDLLLLALRCHHLPIHALGAPILCAYETGDSRLQELLLQRLPANWVAELGPVWLAVASSHGYSNAVQVLLSSQVELNQSLEITYFPKLCSGSRTTLEREHTIECGTALQHSIRRGRFQIANLLLDAGALIEAGEGSTLPAPLHLAQGSSETGATGLAYRLRNCRAAMRNGKQEAPPDSYSGTGVRMSSWSQPRAPGNVHSAEKLLISAVVQGDTFLIENLLSEGADPNAVANEPGGVTPLVVALQMKQFLIAERLLSWGAKLTVPSSSGSNGLVCSALVEAIHQERFDIVRGFIDGANDMDAALECCVRDGIIVTMTPLTAALGWSSGLEDSLSNNGPHHGKHQHEIVKTLVCDFEAKVSDTKADPSPLMTAVLSECRECVQLLLAKGAYLDEDFWELHDEFDPCIITPLTAALGIRPGWRFNIDEWGESGTPDSLHQHELVQALVHDFNAKVANTKAYPSPLMTAVLSECRECVQLLLAKGANLDEDFWDPYDELDPCIITPLTAALGIRPGWRSNFDEWGESETPDSLHQHELVQALVHDFNAKVANTKAYPSPLVAAVFSKCRECVASLLIKGAYLDEEVEFGGEIITPLTAALGIRPGWRSDFYEWGGSRIPDSLHQHELVQALGRSFNAKVAGTGAYPCPLTAAVGSKCRECTQLLLARGAPLTPLAVEVSVQQGGILATRDLLHDCFCRRGPGCPNNISCIEGVELPHAVARSLVEKLEARVCCANLEYEDTDVDMENAADLDEVEIAEFIKPERKAAAKAAMKVATAFMAHLGIDWKAPCMWKLVPYYSWPAATWLRRGGFRLGCGDTGPTWTCCGSRRDPAQADGLRLLQRAIKNSRVGYATDLLSMGVGVGGQPPDSADLTEEAAPTLLLAAARAGSVEMLQELCRRGANVHRPAQGVKGRTALQEAVIHNKLDAMRYLLRERDVSANEPPAEDGGYTALQLAAAAGDLVMAHELIEAGADVNAEKARYNGRTALEAAAEQGRLDMVQLLIQAGADVGDSNFGRGQLTTAVELARTGGFPVLARLLKGQRADLYGNAGAAGTPQAWSSAEAAEAVEAVEAGEGGIVFDDALDLNAVDWSSL